MQVSLRGMFLITLIASVIAYSFQSHIIIAYCAFMFALPVIFSLFFKTEDRVTDESAVFLLAGLTILISAGFLIVSVWHESFTGTRSSISLVESTIWSGLIGSVLGLLAMPYNLFAFMMIRLGQDSWVARFGDQDGSDH